MVFERFKKIDILVNTAGIGRSCKSMEMRQSEAGRSTRVNVRGTFLFSQIAGKEMTKQGKEKIISIALRYAESGVETFAAYRARKGAILSLTRPLAIEWTKDGGGYMDSNDGKKFMNHEILGKHIQTIQMGRILVPSDLVRAVVFLASSASDMVTGDNLYVDRGYLAKIISD